MPYPTSTELCALKYCCAFLGVGGEQKEKKSELGRGCQEGIEIQFTYHTIHPFKVYN